MKEELLSSLGEENPQVNTYPIKIFKIEKADDYMSSALKQRIYGFYFLLRERTTTAPALSARTASAPAIML